MLSKYNCTKYTSFEILYKDKTLENLSFGQRATAIVLVLIILGNSPLIIDEPETHLDQKMISEELVEIIKKVKKNRQLIFATHNANIVINADADQIYVLKQEGNKTEVSQMAIEDVCDIAKKENLLLLEGSEQAFIKRENKYFIDKQS